MTSTSTPKFRLELGHMQAHNVNFSLKYKRHYVGGPNNVLLCMCIIEYRGIYIRITKNIMSGTCGLGAGTHQKFSKVLYSGTCITFG